MLWCSRSSLCLGPGAVNGVQAGGVRVLEQAEDEVVVSNFNVGGRKRVGGHFQQ